jgi:hypothetical protein
MKTPNFFIIGAPKCATSSLAVWLSDHPNVFMPRDKEPNYFNTDDPILNRLSRREYERLFARAGDDHIALGEASVSYLGSGVAVSNILSYCNSIPKFIACVRDPVEMVVSLHGYLVQTSVEDETDFERAWRLQQKRLSDPAPMLRKVNVTRNELQYGERCKIGAQIGNLLKLVERRSLHIVFLDDVKEDAGREYRKILDFLSLPDDGRQAFPVINEGRLVHPLVSKIARVAGLVKTALGIRARFGLNDAFVRMGSRPRDSKDKLPPQFEKELREYFSDDVRILGEIAGRDLSGWINKA